MDFLKALALDAGALLLIGWCVYSASRKGFVRMALQAVLYFTVFLLASNMSERAAPILYDRYIAPIVSQQTTEMENAVLASTAPASPRSSLEKILDFLPDEIDLDYWSNLAQEELERTKDEMIEDLIETTIRPAAIAAIRSMCFALIFFVCSWVGHTILRALGVIRYLPVIGSINAFMGAVLGLGQGLLLVWLIALLLHGLLILGQGSWWVFTPSIIESGFFFRYFFNPKLLL